MRANVPRISLRSSGLRGLARAQRSLDDLAGGRERHLADELEVLRPFHLRDAVVLQPLADLLERHRLPITRHYKRAGFLAHDLVGHGHDRGLQHLWMLVDEDLHVDRIDLYATAIDQILQASGDLKVALAIPAGEVAGTEPTIDERAVVDLGIVVV